MCSIVGAISTRDVNKILLAGLASLEYRGYDSAGLCTIDNGELNCIRTTGKVVKLKEAELKKNEKELNHMKDALAEYAVKEAFLKKVQAYFGKNDGEQ